MGAAGNATHCEPWNKGKIVGQKAPFMLKDILALRVRLQMEGRVASAPECEEQAQSTRCRHRTRRFRRRKAAIQSAAA